MKSLDSVIIKNTIRKDQKIGKTSNEKLFSSFSFMVVFAFFSCIMIGVSRYVTWKLDEFEQTYAFVNMLLLVNFLILFTKSIFESLNILYFSKDLKILLRMPLKPISILHSKLINMIISEYLTEILMLAIPMIVYGRYMKVRDFILWIHDRYFIIFANYSYYDNLFDNCYYYAFYQCNKE